MSDEISKENEQKIRSHLRENFLKATANVNGKQCLFYMHGGSAVAGTFRGADIEFNNILADKLDNPSIPSKAAIFRAKDIIYMTFSSIE